MSPPPRRRTPARIQGSTRRRSTLPRKRPRSRSPRRLVSLFVLLVVAYVCIGFRLVQLQIVEAPAYARRALDQRQRLIELPARRGAIFDRNGEPLAISVQLKTIFADPAHVTDAAGAAARLAPVLEQPRETLEANLRGSAPGDRFEYLARQIEPEVAREIEGLNLPGVYVKTEPKRYYPGARLAAHVLGLVDIDGNGLAGVELQYDSLLRGRAGQMLLEQDPSGRPLPQADFEHTRARPGRSLFLTIDKEIQYATQLALADAVERYGAVSATAIVMRPKTGEILAMANVPDFDPNSAGDFEPEVQRNRALTDMYEPGSAYKLVTVAGALQERVVSPTTTFAVADRVQVADRIVRDSHSHAVEKMTVTQIIEKSSNVGTIQLGLALGRDRLTKYIKRFGFGRPTGLDFPGEAPGIVLEKDEWSGSTIANVPIGQGIAVTPLQMAAAYSTVANDGVSVEPKLVASTLDAHGRVQPSPPAAARRVVSRRTARLVTDMLRGVVERGTGIEAQIPGYRVAGKTGTAQKPLPGGGYGESYIGSFAGFAPANRPALAAVVVLDEPTPIWGGSTAGPTFRTITEFALRHLGIAPSGNAERAARAIEAERAGGPIVHD